MATGSKTKGGATRTRRDSAATIKPVTRLDHWLNALTKLGYAAKDPAKSAQFTAVPKSEAEIDALYEGNGLFRKIINTYPVFATKKWIEIAGSTGDRSQDKTFGKSLLDACEELDAPAKFEALLRAEELYGGAAMIIGANDGLDPNEPLDLSRLESVRYLNVLTRYEITPVDMDRDPTSPTFGQYLYFTSNTGPKVGKKIHHSRVIVRRGILAPRKERTEFWGSPKVNSVYDAIRMFDTAFAYAEDMCRDIVQGVLTINGLMEHLAADDGNDILTKRLALVGLTASAFNAVLLDTDEKYERRTLSGGGPFSDIVLRSMDRLSLLSEIPLSILFGQPPGGLSTDDQSGRKAFHENVSSYAESKLRKPINRLLAALLASKRGPTKGVIPGQWFFAFRPLEDPSEEETSTTRNRNAQTDAILKQIGAITSDEIRARLRADPRSSYVLDDAGAPKDPNDESEGHEQEELDV